MIDVETLELVGDWREDLSARLQRAQLRYELIGAGREEIIELGREVRAFTNVCEVLKQVYHNEEQERGTEAPSPRKPSHARSS
jgi:hypothetical protein